MLIFYPETTLFTIFIVLCNYLLKCNVEFGREKKEKHIFSSFYTISGYYDYKNIINMFVEVYFWG